MAPRLPTLLLLLTLFCTLITAHGLEGLQSRLEGVHHKFLKRKTYAFTPQSGYKISWQVNGKRASVSASTDTLSRTWLATSGAIKQSHLNTCSSRCTANADCQFAQLIQLSKAKSGTVLCSLHGAYVASTKATFRQGPASKTSTVVTTYGLRKLKAATTTPPKQPVTTPAKTTTTTSTSKTMTTKTSTSSSAPASTSTVPPSNNSTTNTTTPAPAPFPATPLGAYFIQFNPCSGVAASVPAFVNNQYNGSSSSSAYIVQHGSARNFNDYFTAVYNIIGNNSFIFAANNYLYTDPAAPTTWYQPKINLAWGSTWTSGGDAVYPKTGDKALNGGMCSTLDTIDGVLNYLDNKSLFPSLTKVYIVAHSGGANLMSKHSQFYNGQHSYGIRYIIANPANQGYFTDARPTNLTAIGQIPQNNTDSEESPSDTPTWLGGGSNSTSTSNGTDTTTTTTPQTNTTDSTSSPTSNNTTTTDTTSSGNTTTTSNDTTTAPGSMRRRDNPAIANCDKATIYPYQLTSEKMNRYVASRFDSAHAVYDRWISRDVVLLAGSYDTDSRFPGGGQECQNIAQGGANRRDRAYAFWAYQNILSGTSTNVTGYYGYDMLIKTGATAWSTAPFNHQMCVVDGVGHDQNAMFASECGVAAMTQQTLPAGAGPVYP